MCVGRVDFSGVDFGRLGRRQIALEGVGGAGCGDAWHVMQDWPSLDIVVERLFRMDDWFVVCRDCILWLCAVHLVCVGEGVGDHVGSFLVFLYFDGEGGRVGGYSFLRSVEDGILSHAQLPAASRDTKEWWWWWWWCRDKEPLQTGTTTVTAVMTVTVSDSSSDSDDDGE